MPDNSPIVCHAVVTNQRQWTGNCRHFHEGNVIAPAFGMIISELRGIYHLTGCDAEWTPLHETRHETLQNAKDQAEYECTGIGSAWIEGPPLLGSIGSSAVIPVSISRNVDSNAFVRLNSYEDLDVVFHLEVYRGYGAITAWCLGRIRECYPGARVIVVSDGDPDSAYKTYRCWDVEVEYGAHLYAPGKAGELWERRFSNFLKRPARFFFRADSDVGFYRRFSALPSVDCLFGTYCIDHIQGGLIGFTREAVERLLSSGMLREVWMDEFVHDVNGIPIPSDDRAIGKAARMAGIPLVNHPEFHCTWQSRIPNDDGRYAVVHPCKDGKL